MDRPLTLADARQSLAAHVEAKGVEAFGRYGPRLGWAALQRLLRDSDQVRYPCEVVFDAGPLEPGECAYPVALGPRPEDGFRIHVHPWFQRDPDRAVYLVLYQLVVVNYGPFASPHEAETFGAAALALTRDEYYAAVCAMADELAARPPGLVCSDTGYEVQQMRRTGQ